MSSVAPAHVRGCRVGRVHASRVLYQMGHGRSSTEIDYSIRFHTGCDASSLHYPISLGSVKVQVLMECMAIRRMLHSGTATQSPALHAAWFTFRTLSALTSISECPRSESHTIQHCRRVRITEDAYDKKTQLEYLDIHKIQPTVCLMTLAYLLKLSFPRPSASAAASRSRPASPDACSRATRTAVHARAAC
jgi:hypothetical protein